MCLFLILESIPASISGTFYIKTYISVVQTTSKPSQVVVTADDYVKRLTGRFSPEVSISALFIQYGEIILKGENDLGCTSFVRHRIHTRDRRLIHHSLQRSQMRVRPLLSNIPNVSIETSILCCKNVSTLSSLTGTFSYRSYWRK